MSHYMQQDKVINRELEFFSDTGGLTAEDFLRSVYETNGEECICIKCDSTGKQYKVDALGVQALIKDEWKKICSNIVVVLGKFRSNDNERWGQLVAWIDQERHLHRANIFDVDLDQNAKAVRATLVDGGVEIVEPYGAGRIDPVIQYLRDSPTKDKPRYRITNEIGWVDNNRNSVFLMPTGEQFGGVERFLRDVDVSNTDTADRYAPSGNLTDWINTIAKQTESSPLLCFALSAAFAAPLLELLKVESGGFHFWGSTSKGKSTLLRSAATVWGSGKGVLTWRATGNGIEGVLKESSGMLLCLDEIREADPLSLENTIYMIGNERGKARATKEGTARRAAQWRSLVLSTGEITPQALLEKSRINNEGIGVRLVNIPINDDSGIFDSSITSTDAAARASEIKRFTESGSYGVAGREFLSKLTDGLRESDFLEQLKAKHNSLTSSLIQEPSGEIHRVAQRFAAAGLAGELATKFGCTGWNQGAATQAARAAFTLWRRDFKTDKDRDRDLLRYIVDSVESTKERFKIIVNCIARDAASCKAFGYVDTDLQELYLFNSRVDEFLGTYSRKDLNKVLGRYDIRANSANDRNNRKDGQKIYLKVNSDHEKRGVSRGRYLALSLNKIHEILEN